MLTMNKRTANLLEVLAYLKGVEADGKTISVADLCAKAGWKASTYKKYLNRGIFEMLVQQPDGRYRVQGAAAVSDVQFLRGVSQSKDRQQFGHPFAPLVRQLLERSRTNMSLAVEMFNRPSLENRLDAFVVMFISSWEQLLKAELDRETPGSIFTGEKTRTGRDKTITFQQCLDRLFKVESPVRRNLEVIRSLRDEAAHLLVAEVQPVAARYFQAGLINYAGRFFDFTGESPFPATGAGLLTLAMPHTKPDVVALRARYGPATADEVVAMMRVMEDDAADAKDAQFAVTVNYRLVLTDEPGAASINLTKGAPGVGMSGFIVEKAKDAELVFCFFEKELAKELTKRTGRKWEQYDVRAAVHKEKVKAADNQHHHHFKKTDRHGYSEECVMLLAGKVATDPAYLTRARESYSWHLHARKAKPARTP